MAARAIAPPSLHARTGRARRIQRLREAATAWLLRAAAFATVAGLALIMLFVFREAAPVFFDPATRHEASLNALLHTSMWQPTSAVPKYGLLPLVLGTAKVVVGRKKNPIVGQSHESNARLR